MSRLRIVVADDERPARAFLLSLLRGYDDVEVVGEAANGAECVELIERLAPDLALLDLQMPEVDGLGVVRLSRGTLVSVGSIQRVTPMPGGAYIVVLHSGHQHQVSRLRARVLREQLLRL